MSRDNNRWVLFDDLVGKAMAEEQVDLLATLLHEVINGTGYGAVEVIVADGRIQNIKMVKSYKAVKSNGTVDK